MDVKFDTSAAQKKYPLYRLAIIPLELLERKPFEMHPSWLNAAGTGEARSAEFNGALKVRNDCGQGVLLLAMMLVFVLINSPHDKGK